MNINSIYSHSQQVLLFLMTTIQRYHRLKNEYDHYERREKMLDSITIQKRDELENLINHINQLLLIENHAVKTMINVYMIMVIIHQCHREFSLEKFSIDEDEESDNDPLLQRLKLTKPSRLKTIIKTNFK